MHGKQNMEYCVSRRGAGVFLIAMPGAAQSFRVQCPTSTITHPLSLNNNNAEPPYTGPTTLALNGNGFYAPTANVNGAIKCQQVSGGDGYSTMANGTQTYMFSFGPLSGLADIAASDPGTEFPSIFNTTYPTNLLPGDPATTDGVIANAWRRRPLRPAPLRRTGAVGLAYDVANLVSIYDIAEDPTTSTTPYRVTVQTNAPLASLVGNSVTITGAGTGYDGTFTITGIGIPTPTPSTVTNYGFPAPYDFTYNSTTTGLADVNETVTATASTGSLIDGHVDPRQIMDMGVMNGNIPAPLMAFDEDDELFLTLTNVGMIMRPDLFEQHTIHFHGYPNARRSMTACRTPRWPSTSAAASPITIWPPMPAPTSGTAISRLPSTCRWAWWGNFTCARGRIASPPATACMRR